MKKYIDKQGYVRLSGHGGHPLEHRYVMEQHLGRRLGNNEIVHHIDHNKQNNSIENLEVMGRVKHSKEHLREQMEQIKNGQNQHNNKT